MNRRFIRPDTCRFSRMGKNRRKLQKWRRVRGKSNKIRLNRRGYSSAPKVGFKTEKSKAGKVNGLIPRLIHNIDELRALGKNEAAILARIGARKKLELIREAEKSKIRILNLGGKNEA